MKILLLLLLSVSACSVFSRQPPGPTPLQKLQSDLTDVAGQVNFNNSFRAKTYDTVYRDLQKTFYVTKAEFKDKKKIDSLFGMSKYFLVDAIKEGYNRIVITITTGKGVFARNKEEAFRCDWLYERITGKKLPVIIQKLQ